MRIAYLASRVTLPGSAERRTDAHEHDFTMQALQPAFADLGMDVVDVAWDDADARWSDFGAAIIGTTWDYWDRLDEFLATLERIGTETYLFNPVDVVRWNIRKTYLRELESRGAPTIPTAWLDRVTPEALADARISLGSDDIVLKRQVGAGAHGQHRLGPSDALPDMPHPMMVQAFLPAIRTEGEYSFIFIDGAFSHALLKRPTGGDYRIQSSYGGTEVTITPSPADLAAAQSIIDLVDAHPLYARVDMVRSGDRLRLMEVEVTEPYLYPLQGPELGQRMADAVARRIK